MLRGRFLPRLEEERRSRQGGSFSRAGRAPTWSRILGVLLSLLLLSVCPPRAAGNTCDVTSAVRRIADLFNNGPGPVGSFFWGDVSNYCSSSIPLYTCRVNLYAFLAVRAYGFKSFTLSQFVYSPTSCSCTASGNLLPPVQTTASFAVFPGNIPQMRFVLSHVTSALQNYAAAFRCQFPNNASAATVAASVLQSAAATVSARAQLCLTPFTDCNDFMPLYSYTMSALADSLGNGGSSEFINNLFNGAIEEWVTDPSLLAGYNGARQSFARSGSNYGAQTLAIHAAHAVALLLHGVWNSAANWGSSAAALQHAQGGLGAGGASGGVQAAASASPPPVEVRSVVNKDGSSDGALPKGAVVRAATTPLCAAVANLATACTTMRATLDLVATSTAAASQFVPGMPSGAWQLGVGNVISSCYAPAACLPALLEFAASGGVVDLIIPDLGTRSLQGSPGGIKLANTLLAAARAALSTCVASTTAACAPPSPPPPRPPPLAKPPPGTPSRPPPPPPPPAYPSCPTCTVPDVSFSYGIWT